MSQEWIYTIVFLAWLFGAFYLSPILAGWLLPVSVALVFSVPISVYSSRVALGHAARWLGLFLIPEEARLPQVLEGMQQFLSEPGRRAILRGNFHSDWASS